MDIAINFTFTKGLKDVGIDEPELLVEDLALEFTDLIIGYDSPDHSVGHVGGWFCRDVEARPCDEFFSMELYNDDGEVLPLSEQDRQMLWDINYPDIRNRLFDEIESDIERYV